MRACEPEGRVSVGGVQAGTASKDSPVVCVALWGSPSQADAGMFVACRLRPNFAETPKRRTTSAASMSSVDLLTSALVGRYDIEREIGVGGMATVYLARDVKHRRAVALKVLKPELGAVLGVERFLAEIQVTANLQHPNLLPLFDSGEAAGLLFYVMPFVEGESLRARLDRVFIFLH